MSQPPWETQPQPGWGPPQPSQPDQGGGWGGDSYEPQWPGQGGGHPGQHAVDAGPGGYRPAPFPQNPVPQHPGPPHRYGQVDHPENRYAQPDHDDYPTGPEPVRRRNGSRTAGIVGGVILLVAGAVTYIALSGRTGSGPAPDAAGPVAAPTTATAPTSPDAVPSTGDTGIPADGTTAGSPPATAGPTAASTSGTVTADPASLDSAATDKTPFTAAGLVASKFKDDNGVAYALVAASAKPCSKVGDKTVAAIVTSAKCTNFFAASWTDPSGRIIVSAMIVPYQDAATATQIADKLGVAHTGDYNQWCPPPGQPHSDVCARLTPAATREGKFGPFHRYLLITTAVFSDLRNDETVKNWLVSAAGGAFQNTLPGMS